MRVNRGGVVGVASLILAGCPTPEHFATEFAYLKCSQLESCDEGAFFTLYVDLDSCRDEARKRNLAVAAEMEANCTYNAEAAAACIAQLESASCADVSSGDAFDGCGQAWACRISPARHGVTTSLRDGWAYSPALR